MMVLPPLSRPPTRANLLEIVDTIGWKPTMPRVQSVIRLALHDCAGAYLHRVRRFGERQPPTHII